MKNMFKINGNPEEFADLGVFHKLSKQFLPYAQERLGFDKPVGINLISDPQNAKNPLGKTAYYNPGNMEVTVFVDNRHVKDILRSMSHELVHHTQNCRGEFDGGVDTGPGYAQEDGHMRKMEEEAYLEGQMLLRDFEDTIKKENRQMSKLNENREESLRLQLQREIQDALTQGEAPENIGLMVVDMLKKAGVNLNPRRNLLDPGDDPYTRELQQIVNKYEREKMRARQKEKEAQMGVDFNAIRAELAASEEGRGQSALKEAEKQKIQNPGPYTTGMKAGYDKDGDGRPNGADADPEDGAIQEGEESLEEGDGTICEECGGNGLHESSCSSHDRKNESLEEEETPKEETPKEETPEKKKVPKEKKAPKKKETEKEKEARLKRQVKKKTFLGALDEGWSKKKDQLLFERLVNKWIK